MKVADELRQETHAVEAENVPATRKVLLVDDSEMTLFFGAMILAKSAHLKLITAFSGEEAVRLAREEQPELILMDAVMPHLNGMQACRMIRAIEAMKHTPIILVTTRGEDDRVLGGYASGCTGYITKPFNATELLTTVERYLRRP